MRKFGIVFAHTYTSFILHAVPFTPYYISIVTVAAAFGIGNSTATTAIDFTDQGSKFPVYSYIYIYVCMYSLALFPDLLPVHLNSE